MASITEAAAIDAICPDNYRYLQDVVYKGSGIVLGRDKQYLLEARLASIADCHGLASINDLCSLLRSRHGEAVHTQVVEAMTTNETYFFRDPAQYDAIRTSLLPELRELRDKSRRLSFWSAASSTGQEAYSLAMLLLEQGYRDWNLQILGTDLSHQVVSRARAARYLQIEVNRGVPASLLVKYFRRQGLDWLLNDEPRERVRFECFDLRQPLRSIGPFDLVFCRNILIYFDADARRRILEEIHETLFRGGWLLLGTGEAPSGLEQLFESRSVGAATIHVAR